MQCKQLEAVLEQDGLTPLPAAAEEHLAECAACRSFLADLSLIVEKAHELPAEVEPPQRIWLSVRAQLQAEGLIQEPVEVPAIVGAAPWWQNLAELFRPRNLAAAGTALILIFVVALQIRKSSVGPDQPPAHQARANQTQVSPTPTQQNPVEKESAGQPAQAREQARTQTPQGLPATANTPGRIVQNKPVVAATHPGSFAPLRPSPSEAAFAASSVALSEAEQNLPSMSLEGNGDADTSLRQNLRTLNEFIAECEQHLKQHPQDQLAREYLSSAYQQKAELIAALLDSGRSEH
jgi:ribosomal protein S15P/S13E